MKRDIPLTREQQELVENNLSLVYWVIMESIHVNETVYGFEYEDLHQEGCIWLCAFWARVKTVLPNYEDAQEWLKVNKKLMEII